MNDIASALGRIQTDMTLLKWMAGFNIALSVAMFGLLIRFIV